MKKFKSDLIFNFVSILLKNPYAISKFLIRSLFHQIIGIVENPNHVGPLTDRQRSIQWEESVWNILQNNRPLNPIPHSLPAPLIVSLTSYADRFSTLHLTLNSILSQTLSPDKVLLWISYKDKDKLPSTILNPKIYGLDIRFCSDIGPYKKIIPTLEKYPDHFIVTADDDIYYWPTWLEELVRTWNGSRHDIVAHRVHSIQRDKNRYPIEYKEWNIDDHNTQQASPFNFATGCAGVIYPPGVFHPDVLNRDVFMSICAGADDVWLYWMGRMNGSMVRRTKFNKNLIIWPGSQKTSLWSENVSNERNDQNIKAMIEAYGLPY